MESGNAAGLTEGVVWVKKEAASLTSAIVTVEKRKQRDARTAITLCWFKKLLAKDLRALFQASGNRGFRDPCNFCSRDQVGAEDVRFLFASRHGEFHDESTDLHPLV